MRKHNSFIISWIVLCFVLCTPFLLSAAEKNNGLSSGQTVYVPAYSHIYSGNRERPFMLTITLSIRNIDPNHYLTISQINYYETQGKLLKRHIDKPFNLKPLESLRYVIPESDKGGGSGANFVVKWHSDKLLNPPIIESIMIGARNQQGISFTSRGKVIHTTN